MSNLNKIPILMYHEISDNPKNEWTIFPENFKEQMLFLKKENYKTISLSQLSELKEEEDDKYVVLTFDDGREGFYKHAYPLLKELDFKATIFVVTDWVNQKDIPEFEKYSGFMNWQQVKEISDYFEIGSHSMSHKNLTKLDGEELIKEIKESKQILEKELNKKIEHFCYPFGAYNEQVKKITEKEYKAICSVEKGFSRDLKNLHRQWVTNNTSIDIFSRLLKNPTISVCLITKNEEKNLDNCLDSVKDFADEIIIADTGSKDKTKEIAEKYTSKIFDIVWEDDFSKARNFSISKATKDWIFIIDADERIDEQGVKEIKKLVNNYDIEGYSFVTRNYSNNAKVAGFRSMPDKENKFSGWFPSIKVRLFQNKPEIKFKGIIHELVEDSIKGKTELTRIPVHHYGEHEKNIEKSKYYLELGKKKAQQDCNSKAFLELAIQYKNVNELDKALEILDIAINKDERNFTAYCEKGIIYNQKKDFDKAISSFEKSLEINNKNSDAYFGLGMSFFHKKELNKAAQCFENALFFNSQNIIVYNNLGAIYERSGKLKEAIEVLNKGLEITDNHYSTSFNLGIALEKSGMINKAILAYKKSVELNHPKKVLILRKINELSNKDLSYSFNS